MKFTKTKLLTALTGVIALTGSAQAKEPDHYFYPAKTWEIATPAMQQVSTSPRCTIATEFNNGFIFSLGGSAKWLEGLSVDFRQPAFEAGRSYSATLSVPGGASAQLTADAVNASRIDISMRGQNDLYDAMSESAVLDINVEDNLFRFYLVGFDSKAEDFESCMALASGEAPSSAEMQNASAMPEILSPAAAVVPVIAEAELGAGGLAVNMREEDVSLHPTVNESIAFEDKEIESIDNSPERTSQQSAQVEILKIDKPDADNVFEKRQPQEAQAVDELLSAAKNDTEHRAKGGEAKRVTEMIENTINRNPAYVSIDETAELPPAVTLADTGDTIDSDTAIDSDSEIAVNKDMSKPADKNDPVVQSTILSMKEPAAAQKPQDAPKGEEQIEAQVQEKAEDKKAQLEIPTEILKTPGKFMPVPGRYTAAQLAELSGDTVPAPLNLPGLNPPEPSESQPDEIETIKVEAVEAKLPTSDIEEMAEAQQTQVIDFTSLAENEEVMTPEPVMESIERQKTVTTIPAYTEKHEKVSVEADFTALGAMEPASASPDQDFAARATDPMLLRKISELEEKLAQTMQQNTALNDELQSALQESRDEQLSISSENWNLEAATMKFHEAERQLKRMGQQLQKERAQCNVEKKELKTMLFDPQLTNQAQLARLAELEAELMRMRAQMGR